MKRPRLKYPTLNRGETMAAVSFMIAAIAITNWLVAHNVWLGFLFFFPIVFVAEFLGEREVIAFAITCAILEEYLGAQPWGEGFALRFVTALINFVGVGLLVSGITRRRSLALIQTGLLA